MLTGFTGGIGSRLCVAVYSSRQSHGRGSEQNGHVKVVACLELHALQVLVVVLAAPPCQHQAHLCTQAACKINQSAATAHQTIGCNHKVSQAVVSMLDSHWGRHYHMHQRP